MTLSTRRSDAFLNLKRRQIFEPYICVNIALTVVLLFVFFYSALFSPEKDNYPVVCIHERLTGEPCASCGLSHAFSLILQGRISEAYRWNNNAMRVFIFFAAQLIMRIVFSVFLPAASRNSQTVDCLRYSCLLDNFPDSIHAVHKMDTQVFVTGK